MTDPTPIICPFHENGGGCPWSLDPDGCQWADHGGCHYNNRDLEIPKEMTEQHLGEAVRMIVQWVEEDPERSPSDLAIRLFRMFADT